MLVTFSPISVADTKIIFDHNFVAPLSSKNIKRKICQREPKKQNPKLQINKS